MRRLVPLVLAVLAVAGCGSANQKKTPLACRQGAAAYVSVLMRGDARLATGARFSTCLTKNQSVGDLANVGQAMVKAATAINAEARGHPRSHAPFALGYFVGAVTRGASKTGGIHANLIGRVTVAATYSPGGKPLSRHFRHLYRKGYAAGKDHG